jgi:Zn-dependent protease with chaperone function
LARFNDLRFSDFIAHRSAAQPGSEAGDQHAYAYVSDRQTRDAFKSALPIELVVAAGVRMFKSFGKAELLGRSVKVGPRQFPRLHGLTRRCAATLGIAAPTVYIAHNPHLNAATYGTNDDAFVLINSALVDHMSDEELLSVIGHECGHIHNNHVVYLTAMHYLGNVAGIFVQSLGFPAMLGLRAWSRRAEITCDRAGALCAGDLNVVLRALTKLALGSQKLYDELDIEAFLEQHEEGKSSIGRFTEVFSTHPWLPKRVLALRAFSESSLYRSHVGIGTSGLSMSDVDERVHAIIKVVG